MDDFEGLKRNLKKLEDVFKMAYNDSRMARIDIGDAENIIKQIKLLLKDAMYELDVHGTMAYKESTETRKRHFRFGKTDEVNCGRGKISLIFRYFCIFITFCLPVYHLGIMSEENA